MDYALGQGTGPLRGIKVVEIAGIGPGPHACMILADLGADVIRVERPGVGAFPANDKDVTTRGRPSVALDLKDPAATGVVLDLVEGADVLVEGMRPGAMERLGLGPDECLARNPRLVYGRMTGWGQDGPFAHAAGHDLNYIAITGALFGLGQDRDRPHFPSNLVGDFGGGSTYLVIGVLAALLEARVSGRGQVVDAAIVDGTAHLNAMAVDLSAVGLQRERAGVQPARRRHPLLRPLRDVRRPAHVGRGARAAVLRRARAAARRRPARPRRPGQPAGPARGAHAHGSRRGRRPSGSRSSRAPTRASRRHPHRCARPPPIRTSPRAVRSSRPTGSPSRRPRPASRALRPSSPSATAAAAPTPGRPWPRGASTASTT